MLHEAPMSASWWRHASVASHIKLLSPKFVDSPASASSVLPEQVLPSDHGSLAFASRVHLSQESPPPTHRVLNPMQPLPAPLPLSAKPSGSSREMSRKSCVSTSPPLSPKIESDPHCPTRSCTPPTPKSTPSMSGKVSRGTSPSHIANPIQQLPPSTKALALSMKPPFRAIRIDTGIPATSPPHTQRCVDPPVAKSPPRTSSKNLFSLPDMPSSVTNPIQLLPPSSKSLALSMKPPFRALGAAVFAQFTSDNHTRSHITASAFDRSCGRVSSPAHTCSSPPMRVPSPPPRGCSPPSYTHRSSISSSRSCTHSPTRKDHHFPRIRSPPPSATNVPITSSSPPGSRSSVSVGSCVSSPMRKVTGDAGLPAHPTLSAVVSSRDMFFQSRSGEYPASTPSQPQPRRRSPPRACSPPRSSKASAVVRASTNTAAATKNLLLASASTMSPESPARAVVEDAAVAVSPRKRRRCVVDVGIVCSADVDGMPKCQSPPSLVQVPSLNPSPAKKRKWSTTISRRLPDFSEVQCTQHRVSEVDKLKRKKKLEFANS